MILNLFGIKHPLEKAMDHLPKKEYTHKTVKIKGLVTPLGLSTWGIQESMDAKLRFPNAMPGSRMETANEGIYGCNSQLVLVVEAGAC